jgi:hypothetical protein
VLLYGGRFSKIAPFPLPILYLLTCTRPFSGNLAWNLLLYRYPGGFKNGVPTAKHNAEVL